MLFGLFVCFLRIPISCAHGFPNTPMHCPFQMESPLKESHCPLPALTSPSPTPSLCSRQPNNGSYFRIFSVIQSGEHLGILLLVGVQSLEGSFVLKGKKKPKRGKKSKFFRVKCRGSKLQSEELEHCGEGDVENPRFWLDEMIYGEYCLQQSTFFSAPNMNGRRTP